MVVLITFYALCVLVSHWNGTRLYVVVRSITRVIAARRVSSPPYGFRATGNRTSALEDRRLKSDYGTATLGDHSVGVARPFSEFVSD